MRPRDVRIQGQPVERLHEGRKLEAAPAAGAIRFRDAAVADEYQLRVQLQRPQRGGELRARKNGRAHSDLATACLDERAHAIGRRDAVGRVHGDGGAARIVRVKPTPDVDEHFGLRPRARDEASFGLVMLSFARAGVGSEAAVHVEVEGVVAHAGDGSADSR